MASFPQVSPQTPCVTGLPIGFKNRDLPNKEHTRLFFCVLAGFIKNTGENLRGANKEGVN
jgi:hypothetical protein